jgi:hypothetical protein
MMQILKAFNRGQTLTPLGDWKLILVHTGSNHPEIYWGEYDELISKAIDRKHELFHKKQAVEIAKITFKDNVTIDVTDAI